ncbi:MAG: phosphoribosylaminoimidazole carboxylase, partial [Phycisphaerales bacterium]|nr:phosphoribosylaminoimidazole carboxylase [Phycisphaerales bacterium]
NPQPLRYSSRPMVPVTPPILPGSTVGVLGSGQLGRMFAIAARQMGYRVHTFSPDPDTPTGQVADAEVVAPYEDLDAVRAFAAGVSVVTFEFEIVPFATAEAAAERAPVRPGGAVLHTTQHRLREKTTLAAHGFPVTPFRAVRTADDLRAAARDLGLPAVLKTASFGYDGKGQVKLMTLADGEAAVAAAPGTEWIYEAFVAFEKEVSVVAARGADGSFAHWGVIENRHANHILDLSVSPGDVPPDVARRAVEIARGVLEQLGVVGVLCVEFFVAPGGSLMINELAPRPHNSGHLTIDASRTSQFEQQLRAVCGLPLGDTTMHAAAAMTNLLGDAWSAGEPNWAAACAIPGVKLHLYGKADPRPGRKMGHLTALAATPAEAAEKAVRARAALARRVR